MKQKKNGYPKSYEKWGIDVVRAGYTLLPNYLLYINKYLKKESKLTSSEIFALILILSNWWDHRKMPAAGKRYIGQRMNLSSRQVQRILRSLEKKKAISRYNGGDVTGGASVFDIRPVLYVLYAIAKYEGNTRAKDLEFQLELDFGVSKKTDADMYPEPFMSSLGKIGIFIDEMDELMEIENSTDEDDSNPEIPF